MKFRVWDLRLKKFSYFSFADGNYCFGYGNPKEYVIQQWTGYTDKSNADIYAGDVVSEQEDGFYERGTWVVEFCKGGFMLRHPSLVLDCVTLDFKPLKVIGNIFTIDILTKGAIVVNF